jgi:hypothetical protein
MKKTLISCSLLVSFAIVSCNSMNQPIGSDFDPLSKPGVNGKKDDQAASRPSYSAGSFVVAASNSTGFFSSKPKGNADAQELLTAGTSMRVIKNEGSYLKIELDNGKIGYVNSIMVTDKSSAGSLSTGNSVQVYPPIDGPLPSPGGEGAMLLPSDTNPNSAPIDASAIDMKPEQDVPKVNIDPAPSISATELPPASATNELPPSADDLKKETSAASELKTAIKDATSKTTEAAKDTSVKTIDKVKKP